MNKYMPLIGLTVASVFLYRAADQLSGSSKAQPGGAGVGNVVKPSAERRVAAAPADAHRDEPAYKAVIRCLGDLDDILDTIDSPASFAAAKPKLLARMRQHMAQAAGRANRGMTQLSKAASKEMQKAANRHTESLTRADKAAPGVAAFFAKDVAQILNQK